jgi:hypothetical protein
MKFLDTSRKLLGWGSVAIGVWGLVHPKSLTTAMGDDSDLGRTLALRDFVVGVALLKTGKTWPLSLRIASDVQDAVRLRERSPKAAAGAVGVAAWAAVVMVGNFIGPAT